MSRSQPCLTASIGRVFRPYKGSQSRPLLGRIRSVLHAVPDTMQSLTGSVEALRALVLGTGAERDAAVSERDTLLAQNDRLRHLLLKLTRMQFGARSERLPEEQLQLGLEALEQAIAKGEAEAEKQNPALRKDN